MLLSEVKKIFHKELNDQYGENEVSSFFYLLIDHQLGLERFVLAMQPNLMLSKEEETPLFEALSKLKLNKPIQHIIGYEEFMDLKFKVDSDVLIPRPETEELVRWIVEDQKSKKVIERSRNDHGIRVLDIGTGSGCISISLAKNLKNAKVSALDVSPQALEIAKSNAHANNVTVNFFEADILDASTPLSIGIEPKYDIIVSNPPYVRELEKNDMSKNVLEHDPEITLFVSDKDPLVFYRAIAGIAEKSLVPNGSLYLEINQYLGKEMVDLLEKYTFKNIELRKDIFGNDRMIKATKE